MPRKDQLEDEDVDTEEMLVTPDLLSSKSAHLQDLRLGFLIHDVSRMRRIAFDHLMKPLGVTRSQWWVIAHLSRHDGLAQSELAALLDIGKVSLGGLVDRLEAGGWVERRPHPDDRRVKRIFLARSAHKLIREMQDAEQQLNRMILKGIAREERTALSDVMGRLKRNLTEAVTTLRGKEDE